MKWRSRSAPDKKKELEKVEVTREANVGSGLRVGFLFAGAGGGHGADVTAWSEFSRDKVSGGVGADRTAAGGRSCVTSLVL